MLYNHSTLEKEQLKEIIKSPQIIMSKTSVCKLLHLYIRAERTRAVSSNTLSALYMMNIS